MAVPGLAGEIGSVPVAKEETRLSGTLSRQDDSMKTLALQVYQPEFDP